MRNLLLLLFFFSQRLHTIFAGNHKKCCKGHTSGEEKALRQLARDRGGAVCKEGTSIILLWYEGNMAGQVVRHSITRQASVVGQSSIRHRERVKIESHLVPFGNLTIVASLSTGRQPEQE